MNKILNFRKTYIFKIILLFWCLVFAIVLLKSFLIENSKIIRQTVFVLDISNSMNVDDIQKSSKGENIYISRLEAAKEIINKFVKTDSSSNSFGLIIFSQNASYFVPITEDYKTFLSYVDNVTTNQLPYWSTNLASAIALIDEQIDNILVLSDFGDEDEMSAQKMEIKKNLSWLQKKNIKWIWLWTSKWWWVVYTNGRILRKAGKQVISKINDKMWNWLAANTNASYKSVSNLADINDMDTVKWVSMSESQILIWFAILWLCIILAI